MLFSEGTRRYLKAVAQSPEAFASSLKRIIGEMITELTFGACADNEGNDYVAKHETLLDYSKKAAAGYVVDFFPILKFIPSWFPFAQFQRDAKVWRSFLKEVRTEMFEGVQQRMAANESRSCYVANTIEELQRKAQAGADIRQDVQAVLDSGFAFYQGGVDTTEYAIKNFLLGVSLYPAVQARAREEIDRVVGNDRLPNFNDQDNLPYIHAIVLESLRWNPPIPFGFPNVSREDDTYLGYFIPKGTMVMKNLWQVSRDPNIYSDPPSFNPDRFVNEPKELDPREWVFGFGRRICAGNHLAYQISWIFIVSLLWGFEIKRPDGEPLLEQDVDRFDFAFLSAPKPFRCDFIPRDGIAGVFADD